MAATVGYDYTGPAQYLFTNDNSTCTLGHNGTGGSNSSWQTNTDYTDSGLDANKCYGYTVTARDALSNAGTASSISITYTSANIPGVPTLNNPTVYTLDLENDANSNPSSNPTTQFAAQVTYTSPNDPAWETKWVDADGNPSDTAVWLSDAELDAITLQDLNATTEYGVSVKAKNTDGDETSLGTEGTGTTSTPTASNEETYLTSGTWVAPAEIYYADVECWGGGGGGGGSTQDTSFGGGGGGGGAYAKTTNISVTPGESYDVIVGTGGSGGSEGANGSSGIDSSFDTNEVIAVGGSGGEVGSTSEGSGGLGGQLSGSVGDRTYSGGDGSDGSNPTGGGGGEGSGSTSNGGTASGQTGGTGTDGGDGGDGGASNTVGDPGLTPGGGGGGAGNGDVSLGYSGGDGADGQCIIYYREKADGTLSCEVTTSCTEGVVVYRMLDATNSHAELPDQTNYSNLICCTGVLGLANSCEGNYKAVLNLSSATNAHVEQGDLSNYSEKACLRVPNNGILEVGYQEDDCNGYDTMLASMSSGTNAHVGDTGAYSTKICATSLVADTLSFNISHNNVGFGVLNALSTRYATNDTNGSSEEAVAHTITASTNNVSGYSVLIQGATLKNTANSEMTIDALGDPGAAPQTGVEQFGIRVTASEGNGTAAAPYNHATNYAFGATDSTPDVLATNLGGDDVATIYSIRYMANIYGITEIGTYSTELTYLIVSNF
jgi:hypothetical protein